MYFPIGLLRTNCYTFLICSSYKGKHPHIYVVYYPIHLLDIHAYMRAEELIYEEDVWQIKRSLIKYPGHCPFDNDAPCSNIDPYIHIFSRWDGFSAVWRHFRLLGKIKLLTNYMNCHRLQGHMIINVWRPWRLFNSIIIFYIHIGVFHVCYDAIKYNMCFDIGKTKISKNNACREDQIYVNRSIDIVC